MTSRSNYGFKVEFVIKPGDGQLTLHMTNMRVENCMHVKCNSLHRAATLADEFSCGRKILFHGVEMTGKDLLRILYGSQE